MARAEKVVVDVEERSETGKNACRRLRRTGRLPANLYGLDRPPFRVTVDPRRVEDVLRLESGRNTIFALRLAGQSTRDAMIREVQRDPVTEAMLHVDFVRVDLTRAIQVTVPVRLIGLPEGVKNEGGVLDFVHRAVEVECLPGNIPEHLDVDVTALHLHQNVSVADVQPPEGVRILDEASQIIAVVSALKEETPVAEVAEAVAAPAEPEVIKRGKEAEEDKAGDKKGEKKREDADKK